MLILLLYFNTDLNGIHLNAYIFIILMNLDVLLCQSVLNNSRVSLVAEMVKDPPTMWETKILSLGWENLLEKGMATHSIFLAWRILLTEEPSGLQSMGLQRTGHD